MICTGKLVKISTTLEASEAEAEKVINIIKQKMAILIIITAQVLEADNKIMTDKEDKEVVVDNSIMSNIIIKINSSHNKIYSRN